MLTSRLITAMLVMSLVLIFIPRVPRAAAAELTASIVVANTVITPIDNVSTWGEATTTDINHDGYSDILLSRHLQNWQLFRFNPSTGKYVNVWNVPTNDHYACV